MERIRLMTLTMVACLLASGPAFGQPPQLPTFQAGDVLKAADLNRIVEQVKRNTGAADGNGGATHTVDCASGTIAAAMARAASGDTIMITGTCNEAVVVDKDGITLDGGGAAVIDGGAVDATALLIKGHQNVTIKGLTIQKGLNGIGIVEGAAAWLENVTVRGSRAKEGYASGFGISVAASSVVLTGAIVANDNAAAGIVVWGSSMAYVAGNVVVEGDQLPQASLQANGNGYAGIEVGTSSALHVYSGDRVSTTVQANNNDGHGISVVQGASAQFGGGADVAATGNGDIGLDVRNGSSVVLAVYGGPLRGVAARFNNNKGWTGISILNGSSLALLYDFDAGATITATGNAGSGLAVGQNSSALFATGSPSFSQFASASLIFSRNVAPYGGVLAAQNSAIMLRLPTEIKNNTNDGVQLWGNSFVELGADMTPGDGVVVADNGRHGVAVYLASAVAMGNAAIEDNAGDGIDLNDNGSLSAYGGPTIGGDPMITDNGGDGIDAGDGADVYLSNATVTGNSGNGINAWGGVGVDLSNTTITGNTGADVRAGGYSRLAWSGSTVGTVTCDPGVLTVNDAACPDKQ